MPTGAAVNQLTSLVVIVPLFAGCCSGGAACDPERLPKGGAVAAPGDVFTLARYAVENDCPGLAYDLLSPYTHDEIGYLKFRVAWGAETSLDDVDGSAGIRFTLFRTFDKRFWQKEGAVPAEPVAEKKSPGLPAETGARWTAGPSVP